MIPATSRCEKGNVSAFQFSDLLIDFYEGALLVFFCVCTFFVKVLFVLTSLKNNGFC